MNTFLIADDHPLFRDAIMQVIGGHFSGSRLLQTQSLDETLELLEQEEEVDLLLLDLNMPGMQGLQGLTQLHVRYPALPVVIVSAEDDRKIVLEAMTEGAVGFISKASSGQQILAALEQLLQGQIYLPPQILRQPTQTLPQTEKPSVLPPDLLQQLTKKQLQVLQRMALGESNKQIAWHLNLAETTVKGHVSAILAKLGMHNRVQVALAAREVLPPDA